MPPQQGGQCPFCQLIENPDQLLTVGETENFYAWLEINPRAKGHTMIVPKEHKENLLELSPGEWQEAMKLTRMVVEKAKKGLGADGASVAVNIEEAGGQMLPHAYIIVFPRFEDEENAGTPTGAIFPQREELQPELEDIQESMSSVSVDFEAETREPHEESKRHLEESAVSKAARSATQKQNKKEKQTREEESNSPEPPAESASPDADSSSEPEDEDAEDELEGEGHWDGKSFEWR